jgi:hypothetical protein
MNMREFRRRDVFPFLDTRKRLEAAAFGWIYLPIGAAVVVVVGLLIALFADGSGNPIGTWSELATIVLGAALAGFGIAAFIAFAALAWGTGWLVNWLPNYSTRVRVFSSLAAYRVRKTANRVVEPLISASSTLAVIQRYLGMINPPAKNQHSGEGKPHGE